MPFGLQIHLEEIDKKLVVRIEGRIDAASAPVLDKKLEQLIEEKHREILLDFTRVDYLSSAGMRVLLAVTKRLHSLKGDLTLFALDADVFDIIRVAGLDKVLHICSNEQEALHKNK